MIDTPKKTLTIGKYRGLQQCSTRNGALAILALDHRNNLRNALSPQSPQSVTDEDLVQFKQLVVENVGPAAPAVLLDPEFGAAQAIAAGVLPRETGLVIAAEATGYTGEPTARASQILPGWSIAKARRMGATGIKLLVYYHPDGPLAEEVEGFVAEVAGDCQEQDIPLFLEPLSYSLDPAKPKLSPEERRYVVIETARRLTRSGVDVLKAEFPLAIEAEADETGWAEACAELTQASQVPWILLSASVSFETYLRQVVVACEQGASGVAVGRAVWQEAVQKNTADRIDFLRTTANTRMARLTGLCDALARPWQEEYSAQAVPSGWYRSYLE
jgi:tagatose-1,6-bisphosphate aldolase